MTRKDVLINWLNDAYATEQSLINVLESHAEHARDNNEFKTKYDAHLAQTRRHAELVEECLKELGSDVSAGKSAMGKFSGWMQGMASPSSEDALLKDALADFSMEQFEIACYKSLITGAEQAGESHVAETCRRILDDEQDMARFLEEHIPEITQSTVARAA